MKWNEEGAKNFTQRRWRAAGGGGEIGMTRSRGSPTQKEEQDRDDEEHREQPRTKNTITTEDTEKEFRGFCACKVRTPRKDTADR